MSRVLPLIDSFRLNPIIISWTLGVLDVHLVRQSEKESVQGRLRLSHGYLGTIRFSLSRILCKEDIINSQLPLVCYPMSNWICGPFISLLLIYNAHLGTLSTMLDRIPLPLSIVDMIVPWRVRLRKPIRETWDAISKAILWHIWLKRNRRIFIYLLLLIFLCLLKLLTLFVCGFCTPRG